MLGQQGGNEMRFSFYFIFCCALLAISAQAQTAISSSQSETKSSDPAAANLLKDARDVIQNFPSNFAGATTEIVFNENGKIVKGSLSYEAGKVVELKIEGLDNDTKKWLSDQMQSVIVHRRGRDFAQGDGRYAITFGADDNSPAGRLLLLGDPGKSSYRVRNKQIAQIDRTLGNDHFTITVLETTKTPEGKFLPRHFSVSHFDASTGAIKYIEAFSDEYKLIDGAWF